MQVFVSGSLVLKITTCNACWFIDNTNYTRSLLTHGSKCADYLQMEKSFQEVFTKPQIYFILMFNALMAVLSAWYKYEKRTFNRDSIAVLELLETILGTIGLSFFLWIVSEGILQHSSTCRSKSNPFKQQWKRSLSQIKFSSKSL